MKKTPLLACLLSAAVLISRPAPLRAEPLDLEGTKAAVAAARANAKKNLKAIGVMKSPANAAKLAILLPYAAEYEPDLTDLSLEALGTAAAAKVEYWENGVVKALQAERDALWKDKDAQGSDKAGTAKKLEILKKISALDALFAHARLLADDAAIDKKLIVDWPAINRETDADIVKRKTALFGTIQSAKSK